MPVQQPQSAEIGHQMKMGSEEPPSGKQTCRRCDIICYLLQNYFVYPFLTHFRCHVEYASRAHKRCQPPPPPLLPGSKNRKPTFIFGCGIENRTANTRKHKCRRICLFILHFRRPFNQFSVTPDAANEPR